jgi:hypothetical protein
MLVSLRSKRHCTNSPHHEGFLIDKSCTEFFCVTLFMLDGTLHEHLRSSLPFPLAFVAQGSSFAIFLPLAMATTASSASTAFPASCKVILANSIAKNLLAEVADGLKQLSFKPLLVGFLANDDPAGKQYADYSAKTCLEK